MPEQVRCPECNAPLRVPDNLLGKNVKCPKCQTTFIAEMDEPTERQNVVREPAPARRSRAMEETEEEELLEEEQEEERPRRRRRGKPRSAAAMDAVAGPAISLMVVGVLDIPAAILYSVFQIFNFRFAGKMYSQGQAPPGYAEGLVIGKAFAIAVIVLSILFGVLLLVGGLKMKKLQSFGLAMTACVLAMLPIHCCCILGLPFGIWGLVTLNKPEVKNAFR